MALQQRFFRLLAVAGMEVCWLYAILVTVQARSCDQCLFLPSLFVFYPFALVLHRFLLRSKENIVLQHLLSWMAWLISAALFTGLIENNGSGILNTSWIHLLVRRIFTLASFPTPEFLTFAGSAVLWGCGKRLARSNVDRGTILSEFQFGVFILLVVFFLNGQMRLNVEGLVPLTVIFFFFALTALPANLLPGGSGTSSKRRGLGWSGIVVMVVCLVLAAGLLAASVLTPELLDLLWSLLIAAVRFVGRWIVKIIDFFMSFLPAPEPHQFAMPAPPSAGIDRDASFIVKIFKIPERIRRIAGMMVSAIWIVLFLAALWSLSSALVKWLLQRMAHPNGAEVETLSGAFKEDLYALMKIMIRKMDRILSILLGFFGIRRIRVTAPPETLSARSIYRQLLRWSARKGCPRRRAQTPGEYLDVLAKRLPGGIGEFSLVTSSYVEERYGSLPTQPGEIGKIHAAWKKVKRMNRKTLNREVTGNTMEAGRSLR